MINRENSLLFLLSLFWCSVFSVRCLLSVFILHLLHVSLDLHTYSYLQCEFVSFNRIFRRLYHESGKQEETENLKRVHVFKENDEEEKETQFSTKKAEIKFMEKVVLVRCSWCYACAFSIATWKLVHLKLEHLKLLIWVLVTESLSLSN